MSALKKKGVVDIVILIKALGTHSFINWTQNHLLRPTLYCRYHVRGIKFPGLPPPSSSSFTFLRGMTKYNIISTCRRDPFIACPKLSLSTDKNWYFNLEFLLCSDEIHTLILSIFLLLAVMASMQKGSPTMLTAKLKPSSSYNFLGKS